MIPDYNLIVCHPNRIGGETVLSGGAWVESLPLANIQDRALARVARSIDADPANTWFDIAFDRQRPIRAFALLAHSISFGGRIQLLLSSVSDFSIIVHDVTFDAWPAAGGDWNIDELEWEGDNYWTGTYSQEDAEGQTPIALHILDAPVEARYVRVKILDQFNTANYVDIGRAFVGNAFLNTRINYGYGAGVGYEDATGIETAISGAEFFDPREPLRVMRFQLSYMDHSEGFSQALELTRRAGTWKEVLVIPDPTDENFMAQRAFVGRLRQLNPLEQVQFQLTSMSFEIKELR